MKARHRDGSEGKPNSSKFFKWVDNVDEDVDEESGDESKQQLEVTRNEVLNVQQKKLVSERSKGWIFLCVVGLCWAIAIFVCIMFMLNNVGNP
ncbi:unnamed protein product [Sphenostylis stenocarpa]|uniref:Transmembrane protein n=1 Tax=Sphenostylis stenocarpa TaxID=92480 RepID=A0AA86SKR0_9FABA|nr:unnamed protein product [Sphenostylis stenocarpa]